MDERLRFVARLLEGEMTTALCAEFRISRKTGYKNYDRYKDYGLHGLTGLEVESELESRADLPEMTLRERATRT